MNDDELTAKLLEAHAHTDPSARMEGPLWEKLAAGTLTAGERRALEAQIGDDAELRASFETLASLSEDRGARDEAVIARIGHVAAPAASDAKPSASSTTSPPKGGRVMPLRRASMVVAALGLAAGLALFVSRSSAPGGSVPGYELEVAGGEQQVRAGGKPAAAGAIVRLGPDARLSIHLRPERPSSEPVEVRAFLVRGGAEIPWSPPVQISPSGAVQIEGAASALIAGPGGRVDAVVGVGPTGALPGTLDALERSSYPVFRVHLELTGR